MGRLSSWGPQSKGAFGNLEFYENCPVTVLTAKTLREIPVPSSYKFSFPGRKLDLNSNDFIHLCKNLEADFDFVPASYILGGESEWVFGLDDIDLTCIAARPCADTSEYLVTVANCACSSLQMPGSLT